MQTETDNDLIPPEVLLHGDYVDVTVVADDRSQATVKRNRSINPLYALWERGTITEEQYEAGIEIARVTEIIGSAVGMRSASLEARVDNSGSAKDLLVEHIGRVRLEAAYSAWRTRLPVPKRMVIDMVTGSISIVAAGRVYRMRKATARDRLVRALDLWLDTKDKILKDIDEQDVMAAHYRAGGGTLV